MANSAHRGPPSRGPGRETAQVFEIKGSVFTLSVLHLLSADTRAIGRELAGRSADSVAFFRNAPVVLDLHALPESAALDFAALVGVLRAHHLIPVGVRNVRAAEESAAVAVGLGVLPSGRPAREGRQRERRPAEPQTESPVEARTEPGQAEDRAAAEPVLPAGKTVTHVVRSGQQIYALGGDLTVLGAVSPGAEILADGNIHVYGPLRGRALAGIRGDLQAHIFCQALEAELVSVAGHYRMIENPGDDLWGKPAHIHLIDERLVIEPL